MPTQAVPVKNFCIGGGEPLTLISGPCVIEGEAFAYDVACELKEICAAHDVQLIFKASYDKANRLKFDSFRGPGIEEGLRILGRIKKELDLPIVTDVHSADEAYRAAEVSDVLQIPAMLCRQTDLIVAAAKTGRVVEIKKGQFMAPEDMKYALEKAEKQGNQHLFLCERGTSFGYRNLVVDMRAIQIMRSFGYPVCFDAAHSVQLPGGGGGGGVSGGQREFVPVLAKSALAAGAEVLYIEAHPNPERALSDAESMMALKTLRAVLPELVELHAMVRRWNHPTVCVSS
ncbi:MAG: 3-deoxy-8-phosphooctulonate synthase [Chlamydiia bacterium]|nr:3-deoxy-8-phosphooctulonate synthase [Chlamydiia bacterium]